VEVYEFYVFYAWSSRLDDQALDLPSNFDTAPLTMTTPNGVGENKPQGSSGTTAAKH
jgi:hypothetical protein